MKHFDLKKGILRAQQGWFYRQIAAEQGISVRAVCIRLRKAGYGRYHCTNLTMLPLPPTSPRQGAEERALSIAARYASGERVADIASDLGVSRVRIYQLIRKAARFRSGIASRNAPSSTVADQSS